MLNSTQTLSSAQNLETTSHGWWRALIVIMWIMSGVTVALIATQLVRRLQQQNVDSSGNANEDTIGATDTAEIDINVTTVQDSDRRQSISAATGWREIYTISTRDSCDDTFSVVPPSIVVIGM